ncbi:18158_t:CDS:2, partial [Gigaspora margarita]
MNYKKTAGFLSLEEKDNRVSGPGKIGKTEVQDENKTDNTTRQAG